MNTFLLTIAVVVFTFALQLLKIGYFRRRSRAVQRALLQQAAALIGEPGSVKMAVPCQAGLYPPVGSLPLFDLLVKDRLLVSTDSSIWLFECSLDFARNGECILTTKAHQVRVLPIMVFWLRLEVLDRRVWVHRRFRSELCEVVEC